MKIKKIFLTSFIAFLCLLSLGGCSHSAEKASTAKEATAKKADQKIEEHYQNALSYLESGENKQAYEELGQIKQLKKAPRKVKNLYSELGYLLAAKKAVTTNDLEKAQTNLTKLEKITAPTALVTQIKALQKEYQTVKLADHYSDEVKNYYAAGNYVAAGGSLQALDSLSSRYQAVALLQEEVAGYETKIASAQASSQVAVSSQKQATAEVEVDPKTASNRSEQSVTGANMTTETSGYTNARSSKILGAEYKKETGSELTSAPNEAVSSMSVKMSNQDVLSAFRSATTIPQEVGDQYYVQDLGAGLYQIEIRHTSSSQPQVSNLKGMYRFNVDTKVAEKLNEISGQYEKVN